MNDKTKMKLVCFFLMIFLNVVAIFCQLFYHEEPSKFWIMVGCSCIVWFSYQIVGTIWRYLKRDKQRQSCRWPMSKFYNFEDEIPDGERVSTVDDCNKCMEEDCDDRHCLIKVCEGREEKFPPNPNK